MKRFNKLSIESNTGYIILDIGVMYIEKDILYVSGRDFHISLPASSIVENDSGISIHYNEVKYSLL